MPDWDDYHAFISTGSGNTGSGKSSGGGGNSGNLGCFTWIAIIISLIWILGKLTG